jgi:integrative and conjugative element protein (TIGR02256 family)
MKYSIFERRCKIMFGKSDSNPNRRMEQRRDGEFTYISYEPAFLESYDCAYVVLSDRAFKSILAETLTHGDSETGGILLGHFVEGIWYIIEVVDPGIASINHSAFFQYDESYVNHQIKKISRIYNYPLTILGMWHRHPGSLDRFSGTDLSSIQVHVRRARVGILSMLVNVDPDLRMTFYYCNKNYTLMKVPHDRGDDLIIRELIELADNEKIQQNVGVRRPVGISQIKHRLPNHNMPLRVGQDPFPVIRDTAEKASQYLEKRR